MSDGFLIRAPKEAEEHFPNFLCLGEQVVSGAESHTCSQQELGC